MEVRPQVWQSLVLNCKFESPLKMKTFNHLVKAFLVKHGENSSEFYLIVLNYNLTRTIICQLSVYYSSVFSTSLLKNVNSGTQSGNLSTPLIKLNVFYLH